MCKFRLAYVNQRQLQRGLKSGMTVTHLFQEFLKSHFSLGNEDDVSDNWLMSN